MEKAIAEVLSVLCSTEKAAWRKTVECRQVGGVLWSGASAEEQAEICMWQSYVSSKTKDEVIAALDIVLGDRTYVVGHCLTLADIVCYQLCATTTAPISILRWLQVVQKEVWEVAPSVKGLPPKLDLNLPKNISGPLPLPVDKRQKEVPSAAEKVKKSQEVIAVATNEKKKKKEAKQKKAAPAVTAGSEDSSSSPFAALDVRVGLIVEAWPHPEAEKLYCEKIDIGEKEPRTIASGLRAHYSVDDLTQRRVLIFSNLKARTMQGFRSEGMVLCAANADHTIVKFLEPPADAAIGSRVYLEGSDPASLPPPATASQVQKKKILEKVLPMLRTNADGVACCDGKPFLLPDHGSRVTAPLSDAPIS